MKPITAIPATSKYEQVATVNKISGKDFFQEFVAKEKAVVIKGMTDEWKALDWDADYFKANETGIKLAVKTGNVSEGRREQVLLSEYVVLLQQYEAMLKAGANPVMPGYLHDVPFFHLFPHLIPDIQPFPLELFPKWYAENWHNYIQFFMGATGSLTPLHFDTLVTNNLFFQIVGKKKFLLIPAAQKDCCYVEGWRWAKFNPNEPDFEKYPLAKDATVMEAIVGPGDILYMPPGMLHQVHGLSYSISFNIDWHTAKSARNGVMSLFQGAPKQNIYYNALIYAGLALKVPPKHIFPYYQSYLNYVS